jgi:hypothetical protein
VYLWRFYQGYTFIILMRHITTIFAIFFTIVLSAQLRINELMTNNVSAVWDDAYNYSMWVELYNNSSSATSQSFYYLTDNPDEPRKWQLPARTIPARGYSILWMERPSIANHAPFRLEPEGGILYLFSSTGAVIDYLMYPAQHRNVSYGRVTDGTNLWVFFEQSSPGASNNGKATASVKCPNPVVTIPGGMYNNSVMVRFETPASGDTIYYNTNGNEPTRTSSIAYTPGSAIPVMNNTVIRAKTFSAGKLSSDITTATYLIGQRNFNLPVVSLVTAPANLTDNTIGIYVAGTNGIPGNGSSEPRNWNQDWDRPANFEYFDKNKVNRLNQELDITIAGGWSRMNAQKSLHIKPKKKYGNNKLRFPLFDSRPNTEYKDLLLRNSGNDFGYSMMRDGMMQSLVMGRMDLDQQAYEPTVLFVNGVYYGIINLRERSNSDLLYTSHGLKEDEVIILDQSQIPNHPLYLELLNYTLNNDITRTEVYEEVKKRMDVDNYINYYITQIYTGNYDWPHNNIKMWKEVNGGKWRWILYDTDFGFNLYDGNLHNFNSLTYALGENPNRSTQAWATRLFSRLIINETFRNSFIDRFSIHLSSTFQPQRVNSIIDSLANRIRPEISFHKNRWGSSRGFENDLSIMKSFSAVRSTNMLNFIRNRFLSGAGIQRLTLSSNHPQASYTFNNEFINDNAITLSSFEGRNFTLKASNIKGYNFKHWEQSGINQSQTLIEWDSDWKYWDASSIPATNWHLPGYSDASWKTGQAQLGYGNKGERTTISYGPDSNNKNPTAYFRKSIDIQNISSLSSATVRIFVDDGAAVYVNGTEIGRYNLPDGELTYWTYTITWNNGDYADFNVPLELLKNGTNVIAVEVHQTSANSSDLIFNLEMTAQKTSEATDDVITNPVISGKMNASIELKAIYEEDPTPDPVMNASIFINEIVASNSIIRDEYGETDDYIELYNAGDSAVDISGWYISDKKGQPTLWQIPENAAAIVPEKGFLLLWADGQPFQGSLHLNFKLSASGEFVGLYAENKFGELVVIDSLQFPALATNMSYSRVPDGSNNWMIQSPTPWESNVLTTVVNELTKTLKVYPTYFTQTVWIENADGQPLQVVDITGRQVLTIVSTNEKFMLDLKHLNKGIYLLKVGEESFRIIKQ